MPPTGAPPQSSHRQRSCFACGSPATRIFYEVSDAPVHSCLLMPTPEAAVAYPRGEIALAFCNRCGFIQNNRFDPSLHEYSPQYEETQAFSPRFNRFAVRLARHLIDEYDLRDKTILEVGCGKADFLTLLCRLGGNRGVGIDPAAVPKRLPPEAAGRVRLLQERYSASHAHLSGDLVCCRHTLEHIQPVEEFVVLLVTALRRTPGAVLFLEVPDVYGILEAAAFWDVYYEHCSYFSRGSLGRLMARSGLRLTGLQGGFGEQYLLAEGTLQNRGDASGTPPPEDLSDLAVAAAAFAARCRTSERHWRQEFRGWRASGRRIAIWGSGSKCVAFLTTLGVGDQVEYVVDINPHRHGRYVPGTGHRIVGPEFVIADRPDVIVVMNPLYLDEIQATLDRGGHPPQLVPADAAPAELPA